MDLNDLRTWPAAANREDDPRWKLGAAALAILAVMCLHHPATALLAFVASLCFAWRTGLPGGWLLRRLLLLASTLALFALPLPFLLDGEGPNWQWGPVSVSAHGLRVALLIAIKALTVVTLALSALATSPLDATLQAAYGLRVPGLFVQLGLLAYRYLFLFADEHTRLRIALRVRGYRNSMNLHSYRTVGHVAGTLLVRGHDRAERVSQAMRCRGFDGRFRSLATFETRSADVVLFLLVVTVFIGLVALDRSLF